MQSPASDVEKAFGTSFAVLGKPDQRSIQMEATESFILSPSKARVQKSSDTLASIDRVAQELSTLPAGFESPKSSRAKKTTVDKNGALTLSAVRSPSVERRHVSPLSANALSFSGTSESKIDQLASSRLGRSGSVKKKEGESQVSPKQSHQQSHLMTRRKSQSLSSMINRIFDENNLNPSKSLASKSANRSGEAMNRSAEKLSKSNERIGFNANALAIAMETMPATAAAVTLSTLVPGQALLTLKAMKIEQAIEVAAHLNEEIQQAFKDSMDSEQIMGFNLIRLTKEVDLAPVEQIAREIMKFPAEQAAQVIKVISSEDKQKLVLLQIENPELRFEIKKYLQ